MNELQRRQLDLLIKLDEVCKRHNLRYYLAYGTCLGAVRHKGFIPWDHDVDVLMPIEDAEKLADFQDDFGERYVVKNRKTDAAFRGINMRLEDMETKCRASVPGKPDEIVPLRLDIYLFYDAPKSKIKLTLNVWRSHLYKILLGGPPQNHGIVSKAAGGVLLFLFPKKNRARDIERLAQALRAPCKGHEIATYFGEEVTLCSTTTYEKAWFSEPVPLEFEGRLFDGPTDPDKYLTRFYGDYMTPPPEDKRTNEIHVTLIEDDERERKGANYDGY